MKVLAVVAVLFVASAYAAPTDIWSNCGSSSDHLKNLQISVTPDPPKKGQDVTIAASGTLDEEVSSGKITVEVEFLGIKVVNKTLDLCQTISKYQQCPIKQGPLSVKLTESLPSDAPSGHYTGKATITAQSGAEVACVSLDFNLSQAPQRGRGPPRPHPPRLPFEQSALVMSVRACTVGGYIGAARGSPDWVACTMPRLRAACVASVCGVVTG
eukprot:TRINITY_DN50706_c0_g1_i1.p3 TRINITY_DN50706_c0_g1~~TRINITY_DN50706_c0_g1_i1.p3  ORF type:complete len:227 (+),score=31.94 TRINITY_DN50706_c0_g1_i1:44-682(+)